MGASWEHHDGAMGDSWECSSWGHGMTLVPPGLLGEQVSLGALGPSFMWCKGPPFPARSSCDHRHSPPARGWHSLTCHSRDTLPRPSWDTHTPPQRP